MHLEPRTQYEVQVRALNGEGDPTGFDDDDSPNDNWSTSGRGTTGASNERPVFDSMLPVVVELKWRKTRGLDRASAAPSRPRTPTATG